MNKTQLITSIADNAGVSQRVAERLLNATVQSICNALESGDPVKIAGFGTFNVLYRAERTGRNVRTSVPVKIGAKSVPVFKPSQTLKDRVSNIKVQKENTT